MFCTAVLSRRFLPLYSLLFSLPLSTCAPLRYKAKDVAFSSCLQLHSFSVAFCFILVCPVQCQSEVIFPFVIFSLSLSYIFFRCNFLVVSPVSPCAAAAGYCRIYFSASVAICQRVMFNTWPLVHTEKHFHVVLPFLKTDTKNSWNFNLKQLGLTSTSPSH